MRKIVLFLLVLIVFIISCTQKIEQPTQPLEEDKKPDQLAKQTLNGCDGICDNFEKQHTESPCYKPDCLGIKEDQFTKQGQKEPEPPPECIGKTETDVNLPQSCKNWFSAKQLGQAPPVQLQQEDAISVKATGAEYKIATSKPAGGFTTGQDADILLSGIDFNNAGGTLSFNHLGVSASDGVHLIVPDRFNNRVLIWNKMPIGNMPPDLVLGQKDFISNNPGTGLDQMNWPVSVSVSSDGKIAVADTMNARILLWNSFPTKNGQPADIVLSGRQGTGPQKTDIAWPWGVWTDGKKLAVTSTRGSTVLIWNTFPITNDQKPDIYLTANSKFGTPRTITSDGKRLIVSDHNAKVPPVGYQGGQINLPVPQQEMLSGQATFFWKSFPTANDAPYDFYLPGWLQGTITNDNKLMLLGDKLYIWEKFPENADDSPDLDVGRTGPGGPGFYFETGDGSGIIENNGTLYISLYNGNKIVGYKSLPQKPEQNPDFVIGSSDIDENTLKTRYFISNPQPATDGKSLFVVSDFERKFYVWKNIPDESGAKPDFVYDFFGQTGNINFQASGIALGQNALSIVGRGPNEIADVYIWTSLPLNGELPDRHFTGKIGSIQPKKASGVAIDEKYFYLSDELANKIYVWEGIPKETDNPKFILSIESPSILSSDGEHLLVNTMKTGANVNIYEISSLSSNSKPRIVQGIAGASGRVYLSNGQLFTASTSNSQVRVWKALDDAISGRNPDVILGEDDLNDEVAEIGKNKLFWPMSLAFDGSYLWVGEIKFSNRLLRFSVR